MRRPVPVGLLVLLSAVFAVVSIRSPSAEAHGVLLRSEPTAGATLDQSPKTLELWFSEGLARGLTQIRLLDASGTEVGSTPLTFNPADDKQVSVDVPKLEEGTYVVAWSSFSTVDGHRLDGSFAFGIGVAPEGGSAATAPDFTPSAREVVARWVHLIGALALGGVIVVALLLGRPREGAPHPSAAVAGIAILAALLLLVGDAASLVIRADRAGGPRQIGDVIGGSDWGELWLVRLIVTPIALVLVLSAIALRGRRYRTLLCAAAFGVAYVFWAESSASHAAARTSGLPILADFVHLASSSAWIGAVLSISALLIWSRRDATGTRRTAVARTVRRLAWVAATSFALILATGVYRTVQEVPSLEAFVETTYGKALTAKLVLVVIVLAIGATNFLLARRWWEDRRLATWRRMLRSLSGEAVVGSAIIAAVSLLTIATPAASLGPNLVRGDAAAIGSVFTQKAAAGDLEVEMTVAPSDDGRVRVTASFVQTQSSRERPLTTGGLGITQVRFRFRPVDGSIGEARVIAERQGEDETFVVEGPYLPLKGEWAIQVDVRRRSADDVSARFVYDTEVDQRPAWVRVLEDRTIVFSIAQDSAEPNILLAGAAGDGIYRSMDGGETWNGPTGPGAYRIVAIRDSSGTFLAAGPDGVFQTDDNGVTWANLFGEEGNTVWDIAIDPRDTNIIVIATRRGIYRSADGGRTWGLRLPTVERPDAPRGAIDDQWTDLAVGPDGSVLTGRRPGVLAVSRDSGLTWQEFKPEGLELPGGVMGLMIDPDDPNRWFVGSMGSGVWASRDAGMSWRQVTNGLSVNGHGAAFAKSPTGETLVATTGQGVLASANGVDWTPVGDDRIESAIAEDVFVVPNGGASILLVGGIGIYRLEVDEPTASRPRE